MKLPTTLLNLILRNEAMQVSVAVERDCQEIDSRFEHEGMSFLTITLPVIDEALIQGLTNGRLTPDLFPGFKPWKRGGMLPALMSGFFKRVFELDGSLKENPCIASIRAIRQVARTFKKVELPCSDTRVKQAFERYISNDENVDDTAGNDDALRIIAGYLWSDLEELSGALFCATGVFGSGATAEKLAYNQRHSIRQWPERAEPWFPLSHHCSNRSDDTDSFDGIEIIREGDELPVRVVQVPKTLKTPRIISVEPSYMMLMQQSIAKPLMAWLESEYFQHSSIRFTDQSVNREMARLGSMDGSYATIDLKDASDMVSNNLVQKIFSVCPSFLGLIQACRSTTAKVPNAPVITLRKFASQGSALCFPIEAMVFFTIVVDSICRQLGKRPSRKLLSEITANVSVYGDDIIVPTAMASGVMADLEAFGLKVNHTKSFTTGFFRESCGGDYYKGVDITPTYVTAWDLSGNTRSSRVLAAYVSLSNQFYMKGLWHVSQHIRDHVERQHGTIQLSTRPVGVFTWASVRYNTGLRWDKSSCGWRLKGLCIRVGRKADAVQDIRAGMLLSFGRSGLRDSINALLRQSRNLAEIGSRSDPEFWTRDPDNLSEYRPMSGRRENGLYLQPEQSRTSFFSGSLGRDALREDDSWDAWIDNRRSIQHLEESHHALDFLESVDSYVSNTKRRWSPTPCVGLPGWVTP